MWAKVRDEVAAGRQAYVVCPLIEECEKLEVALGRGDLRAARGRRARPACASACCTAGCRPAEKEAMMAPFRAGRARGARRHHGDRGRRRRPQRHGDGRPRRRPLRHRPAPPAPRAGSGAAPTRRTATWSAPGDDARRPRRRLEAHGRAPTTASSWPRSTSRSAARARSSASARRVAATSSWRRCAPTRTGSTSAREVAFDSSTPTPASSPPRPGRGGRALPRRRRPGLPPQGLNRPVARPLTWGIRRCAWPCQSSAGPQPCEDRRHDRPPGGYGSRRPATCGRRG